MRLGIDFDNTIVAYDALFHRVAVEDALIPPSLPVNKTEVRNFLRAQGREDAWTELQGRVYGPRLADAQPYPGVLDFFIACHRACIPVAIISHKTRHPFLGPPHDLHAAAWNWLELAGFFHPDRIGLPRDAVFLEPTKAAKLERIARWGCTHFIDDLPEFLAEPAFPTGVIRILFDPAQLFPQDARFQRLLHWSDAPSLLALPSNPTPPPPPTAFPTLDFLASLFRQHHLPRPLAIEPLPGGANNRVARIPTPDGPLVVKSYFQHPDDPRDRFAAEFALYQWAASHHLRHCPEPLGWDPAHRLGIFRFVQGRSLLPHQIEPAHIDQAASFVHDLNLPLDPSRSIPALPLAAEACFSLQDHLDCVERRVARLDSLAASPTHPPPHPTSDLDRAAALFVANQLRPAWARVRQHIEHDAHHNPALLQPLPPNQRILSPSDFGFHNALLSEDGTLRFFDFEYAGLDDPAKLICDFFSQPRVPVPLHLWDRFLHHCLVPRLDPSSLARRAASLLPAYQIKWVCILLNEFLPAGRARRSFAHADLDPERQKADQLHKAQLALAALRLPPSSSPVIRAISPSSLPWP